LMRGHPRVCPFNLEKHDGRQAQANIADVA
jgi:hypothetical protein